MKKIISVCLFLTLLCLTIISLPLHAARIRAWVGYATVTMEEANNDMDAIKEIYESLGSTVTTTKYGSGYVGGIDYGILRMEYLSIFPVKISASGFEESTLDSSLTSLLFGINLRMIKSVTIGLYAGFGHAIANINVTYPEQEITKLTGYCISVHPAVIIRLSNFILNCSYRYANFGWEGNLRTEDGKGFLVHDYSGLNISIGFVFGGSSKTSSINNL